MITMRFVVITMLLSMLSCAKEKSCEACLPSHQPEKTGVIFYSGPVAADGCDWCIRVDNVTYSPDNLTDAFKQTITNTINFCVLL